MQPTHGYFIESIASNHPRWLIKQQQMDSISRIVHQIVTSSTQLRHWIVTETGNVHWKVS